MDARTLVSKIANDVSKQLKRASSDELSVFSDYSRSHRVTERISTGNLAIDYVFGGGVPVGKTIEIFGAYSSGKSLLCHEIMAQVNRKGGICLLEDTESAYDPAFGERIGVQSDYLLYSQPDTVEDVFDHIIKTIDSLRSRDRNRLLCIVWDSLAATSTQHEMDVTEKADMTKPKLISAGMRRITRRISKERAIFLVVNQTREKVGIFFGNPETTPGGHAVPFHSSIRVRLSNGSLYSGHAKKIKDGKKVIGARIVVDCVKNKVSPPFRKCEAIISFETGLIPWSGMADLLVDVNRVQEGKKGSYEYKRRTFEAHEIEKLIEEFPELVEEQDGG